MQWTLGDGLECARLCLFGVIPQVWDACAQIVDLETIQEYATWYEMIMPWKITIL